MSYEQQIGKDVKGSGHGLFQGNILAFAWRDWENPQETSAWIVSILAKIWIEHLSNKSRKRYPLSQPVILLNIPHILCGLCFQMDVYDFQCSFIL
jgi:hypothetical protein